MKRLKTIRASEGLMVVSIFSLFFCSCSPSVAKPQEPSKNSMWKAEEVIVEKKKPSLEKAPEYPFDSKDIIFIRPGTYEWQPEGRTLAIHTINRSRHFNSREGKSLKYRGNPSGLIKMKFKKALYTPSEAKEVPKLQSVDIKELNVDGEDCLHFFECTNRESHDLYLWDVNGTKVYCDLRGRFSIHPQKESKNNDIWESFLKENNGSMIDAYLWLPETNELTKDKLKVKVSSSVSAVLYN